MTHPARRVANRRRGFSMILVMLAIGLSLAVTFGFMRTQITSLQSTQNDSRNDLALEAARTGISGALLRMQSTSWTGMSDTYSKVIQQDSANIVSCSATYSTVTSGQVAGVTDSELPLHVAITSVGTWVSPSSSTTKVMRTVKAIVRLTPRLPGRSVRDGDVSTATDLSTNSDSYTATLPYTLTTTSSTSTSLNFDPGMRIEGPVWLSQRLALFNSASWSSSIRGTMLTEIGNQYGAANAASMIYPHPLTGPVSFSVAPASTIQTDLSRLKTTWATTTQTPSSTPVNINNWLSYRLYEKGPVYSAVSLSSSLSGTTLQPTVTNPLGIFVRSGNLDVNSQVTVIGTLVVSGTISIYGTGTSITAYNWLSSGGTPAISGADTWPRLPAIVAKAMTLSSGAQAIIEGAVMIDGTISGGGADYTNPSYNQLNISGNATATPTQQPYSTVQLQGAPDLSSVSGNRSYAVWLANGTSGRWFPIQSVDNVAKTLTVIGEIRQATAVAYKISLNRSNYVNLIGPVVAGNANFASESMWGMASIIWTNTTADWNTTNAALQSLNNPRISFPDWVSNPANLYNQGWFLPWNTAIYGLRMEPTTSIQPMPGIRVRSNTPLFKGYTSTGSDSAASGYRWKVVDWREDL
ncbi:MAG: hypothetical protein U0941_10105 [Planctomycetaceae bacterium]